MNRIAERLTVWSLWLLMLANVGTEVLGQTQLISFGFYTLHIVDPAVVLSFIAWAAYQTKRPPGGGILIAPVLFIAVLVMMNFARGMAVDSNLALLNARQSLATASLLMLALTCDLSPRLRATFSQCLIVSASLVALLGLIRFQFGPGLFMTNLVEADQINDGGRVLSAFGAFNIALAATLLFSELLRGGVLRSPLRAVLFACLVAMEVATGQGTATLAMLTMLVTVLILERGAFRGLRAAGAVFLLVIAAAVWFGGGVEELLGSGTLGSFDVAKRSHNLETREAVWAALKVGFAQQSLFDQLFGMPAGQLPPILVALFKKVYYWTLSIHSMYYGSLPMMGYVGMAAYIFLLVTVSVGTLVDVLRRASRAAPAYSFAMCVGTAALSYSYEVRNASLLGLFIAIWWYRAARQRAPTKQATERPA
jgi:hypothetical protein